MWLMEWPVSGLGKHPKGCREFPGRLCPQCQCCHLPIEWYVCAFKNDS